MKFIDLKAQYEGCREDINQRIQAVLEHGLYVNGQRWVSLRPTLRHSLALSTPSGSQVVPML